MTYNRDNIVGVEFRTPLCGSTRYKVIDKVNDKGDYFLEWVDFSGLTQQGVLYQTWYMLHQLNNGRWIVTPKK